MRYVGRAEWLAVSAGLVIVTVAGCDRDARLVGRTLRVPVMKPVSYDGVDLGSQASARQVAWAMLKAIHDDVRAKDAAGRDAAQEAEFNLCAAPMLAARAAQGLDRAELLYRLVNTWAPMLARYINNFTTPIDAPPPELEEVPAATSGLKSDTTCEVRMPLTDPEDPRAAVYLRVQLVRVDREDTPSGSPGEKLWRVIGMYFETWARPPATAGAK